MRETPAELAPRLREALVGAEFTVDAVRERLGKVADAALLRSETTPALRRTAGDEPLDTLVRLFLLQRPVTADAAERALPQLVESLVAEGVLDRTADEVVARLDVRPYDTDGRALWVVSDLTPGLDGRVEPMATDHVLGVTPASTSLAQLTVRDPAARALDLGTGSGVQALHLADHADSVIATDVNLRALGIARFNAALNAVGERVEVREGSLYEPVANERFDLVVTNPPFVISPATDPRLVYRDSGLPGDRVVEEIVRTAPDHLTERGWCQIVANWVIAERPWDERLTTWLAEDCDALVVQRDRLDPAAYVELWLHDAGLTGPEYLRRYDAWLGWLEEQRVEAIGFGWITLRAGGTGRRSLLDWPHPVEQPVAPAIRAWFETADVVVDETSRLVRRDDVVQETVGAPGAEDPQTIVLRQQRGFRRARSVDTVEAAVVGACDGQLSLGPILDAVAQLVGRDPAATRAAYLPAVRELVDEGFLTAPG